MFARWTLSAVVLSVTVAQGTGVSSYRPVPAASPDRTSSWARPSQPPLGARQGGGRFGGGQPDAALTDQFDANQDGRLDAAERRAAREHAEASGFGRGGRGRRAAVTPAAGDPVAPDSARPYPTTPFFDLATVRTFFLEFENDDWERELMAFKPTDVEVPADVVVDGQRYADVGVQLRGNSSFSGVPIGLKHSISLNVDWIDGKQDIQGYNNITLLNAHEDPSFVRTALYLQIARSYIPAPQANFVRVVINGEDWGLYVNQQHFNKALLDDLYETDEGTRWKVPGSPGRSNGGLVYLGEDPATYRRAFEIKSNDTPEAWEALIRLTRVLDETPAERLEEALAPILDIESTLKFLALDNAFVNTDGYWTRGSDYSLYLHPDGRFRLLPYDVNSTFPAGGGGSGRGGGRGGSPDLDPLRAASDPTKPLISKLLTVPAYRAAYLSHMRAMAETWLDWNRLGPIVAQHQARIAPFVDADRKKLSSTREFEQSADDLRLFVERRREVVMAATAPGAGR